MNGGGSLILEAPLTCDDVTVALMGNPRSVQNADFPTKDER